MKLEELVTPIPRMSSAEFHNWIAHVQSVELRWVETAIETREHMKGEPGNDDIIRVLEIERARRFIES